jgi:hypothetical protein
LFEEASALNTNAAIFDLKKWVLQEYVQLDVSANIPWFKLQMPKFRSFLEVLQTTYARSVNTSKTLSAYLLWRNLAIR